MTLEFKFLLSLTLYASPMSKLVGEDPNMARQMVGDNVCPSNEIMAFQFIVSCLFCRVRWQHLTYLLFLFSQPSHIFPLSLA